jgi:hypothetical protein
MSDNPSLDNQSLGGGIILPPSEADYRRMWEQQSKQMKPQDIERESERNKRAARRQVFQEAVQAAVAVKDSRLIDVFHSNVNITEPSKQTKRQSKRKG